MDGLQYNERVICGRCPYCSGKLGDFKRRESPDSEYKNCSKCGIIWEIIGNFACKETKD